MDAGTQIRNMLEAGIDLDVVLKEASEAVFSLDKQYHGIFTILASEPATEYQLGKEGGKYGLDRDSVRRRLLGTTTMPDLEEVGFLRSYVDLFRTGKKTKQYSLTTKGVLASLANTKFDDVFNVKVVKDALGGLTDNEFNIADLVMLYAKYHTALVLLWHTLNRNDLTRIVFFDGLFSESALRHILYEPITTTSYPMEDYQQFVQIGKIFLVVRHIIKQIIAIMVEKKSAPIFTRGALSGFANLNYESGKDVARFLEKMLIGRWFNNVNLAQGIKREKKFVILDETQNNDIHVIDAWQIGKIKMQKMTEEIFTALKIKSDKKIEPYELLESYENRIKQKLSALEK